MRTSLIAFVDSRIRRCKADYWINTQIYMYTTDL